MNDDDRRYRTDLAVSRRSVVVVVDRCLPTVLLGQNIVIKSEMNLNAKIR